MKRYVLTGADAFTHAPDHPERTAKRFGKGLDFDVTFQVWPNRASLTRSVRMQECRGPRPDDWRPCMPLSDGEGY